MIVRAISTPRITPNSGSLTSVLDAALSEMAEGSILTITSKIVSLCEGRVVPIAGTDKDALVKAQAERYLPANASPHHLRFSIVNRTLIPEAGIDASNGDGHYVLWPADSQSSANQVRAYLVERFGLKQVGVIISDSTCTPLRLGTSGISLAHSGFQATRNYVGEPDLFGRTFDVSQANVAGGLAAAAVAVMGEGSEQTPLAMLEDLPFIVFQPRDPTREELETLLIEPEADLFAPFITSVEWLLGEKGKK